MKTKILSLILSLVMVITMVPKLELSVSAANVVDTIKDGNGLTFNLYDDGTATVFGSGKWATPIKCKRCEIPAKIKDHEVTEIVEEAFVGAEMEELILPDSLIKIANEAFSNCKIESLRMSHVKMIEGGAFRRSKITRINSDEMGKYELPTGLESIGSCAFASCENMESLWIPDSVKVIKQGAVKGCKNLKEVNTKDLGTANIPEGVEIIGGSTLGYNTGGAIGVFKDCNKINVVNLPRSLKRIEQGAFANTSAEINCSASSGEVNIPEGVEYIGDRAFAGCEMKSLYIPCSVKIIERGAFKDCKNLKEVNDNENTEGPRTVNIPEGVERIGGSVSGCGRNIIGVFEGCSEINMVNLPRSLKIIGHGAFANTSVEINCSAGSGKINIPDGVECIGASAFEHCSGINSINFSGNVRTIAKRAFANTFAEINCSAGSEEINIPDGVECIEESAFENCNRIKSVNIPASVKVIGASAFGNCREINSINFSGNVKTIAKRAFANCINLVLVNATEDSKNVNIPDGVECIEESAFENCNKIKSVNIPGSVEYIGKSAFENCGEIIFVNFLGNVRTIAEKAFASCRSLSSINFSGSVGIIGEYAFASCKSLRSIKFSGSVGIIGEHAFAHCVNLASVNGTENSVNVNIPDGVECIGKSAFEECWKIKSVNIPASVRVIGANAFKFCFIENFIISPDSCLEKVSSDFLGFEWVKTVNIYVHCGDNEAEEKRLTTMLEKAPSPKRSVKIINHPYESGRCLATDNNCGEF